MYHAEASTILLLCYYERLSETELDLRGVAECSPTYTSTPRLLDPIVLLCTKQRYEKLG